MSTSSTCEKCPYWVTRSIGGCYLVCRRELEELARQGVTMLVSLTESDELLECWRNEEEYHGEALRHGIKLIRLPVPDFAAPDPDEACTVYEMVRREEERGGRVVFHCYAGYGRTGTMIVGYLKAMRRLDVSEALQLLRKANPCAGPQSMEQEFFVEMISC